MLDKNKFLTFTLIISLSYFPCVFAADGKQSRDNDCYPKADFQQNQYLIGYGSLVQAESKNKTASFVGESIPVLVQGYQRGWFAKGITVGFSTTYLGVIKNKEAAFNGVMFKIKTANGFMPYDKRERFYCRVAVAPIDVQVFIPHKIKNAQFWLYVIKPEYNAAPSADYPIVQSYVDVFLSGCLTIQQQYHLTDFANQCIRTTAHWSTYWVNDRIYPRRPFIYQPKAEAIDALLAQQMPAIFNKIKIES